ncbi:hypothetical protein A33O_08501 [Nitratireductor aquibiodomus RA22]|uniref:Uncharacterized protein n=1 Tax=Nitratireductor aquibiodomus RA22 TaxID=1189611 RepID=I5C0C4_9HYPH|nr:hypothetical protein A33O_08501 [Nitratireductor aquibiodomus RA22]
MENASSPSASKSESAIAQTADRIMPYAVRMLWLVEFLRLHGGGLTAPPSRFEKSLQEPPKNR